MTQSCENRSNINGSANSAHTRCTERRCRISNLNAARKARLRARKIRGGRTLHASISSAFSRKTIVRACVRQRRQSSSSRATFPESLACTCVIYTQPYQISLALARNIKRPAKCSSSSSYAMRNSRTYIHAAARNEFINTVRSLLYARALWCLNTSARAL